LQTMRLALTDPGRAVVIGLLLGSDF
jgi:hypothetical protein